MVAIFSEHTQNLPAKVTPQYLLQHTLILEYARAHVRALTMSWLAGDGAEVRPAMELDNLEAVRRMVAAGLGASVVPASVVSEAHPGTEVVARPLKPTLIRTLALAQRRDKPNDPALAARARGAAVAGGGPMSRPRVERRGLE